MAEALLALLSRHPPFEQRRRHGVAPQVRLDALGDARQRRRCLHELLAPARGIRRVAPGGQQRPRRTILERRPECVRACREPRDLALLAALGMRDPAQRLVTRHLGPLPLPQLRHPGTGLEQRFAA